MGWILADNARAGRLLELTGLTPDALREGLGNAAVLAAVLDFLAGHEPDLLAASKELGLGPQAIIAASRELSA